MAAVKDKLKNLFHLDALFSNLEGLVEARIARFRIEIEREITYRLQKALLYGVVGLVAFVFVLMISVAVAFWLGSMMGHTALGFLVVAGVYLLVMIAVILYLRKVYPQAPPPSQEEPEEETEHVHESHE